MTCVVCNSKIPDQVRVRLCFDCWRSFGEPKDKKDFEKFLKQHPSLASALYRKLFSR